MRCRCYILLLSAVMAATGCKPERPQMTEYRVSLREALQTEAPGGIEPGQEAEPVAMVGRDVITLGEMVRVLQSLPPFIRYYYSAPDKAMTFLQNYIIMNLCAREGEEAGLTTDPGVRMELLAAMEKQIRTDHLADRIRVDDGDSETLEARRETLWSKHLEGLRADIPITIHDDRVQALADRITD